MLEPLLGGGRRGERPAQLRLVGGHPRVLRPLGARARPWPGARAPQVRLAAFAQLLEALVELLLLDRRLLADRVRRRAGLDDRLVEAEQRLAVLVDLRRQRLVLVGASSWELISASMSVNVGPGEERLEHRRPLRLVGLADALGELAPSARRAPPSSRLLGLDPLDLEVEVGELADQRLVRGLDLVDVVDEVRDAALGRREVVGDPRRARRFVCAIAPARFACELLSWAISCFWSAILRWSARCCACASDSSSPWTAVGASRRARRTARRGGGSRGWRGGGGIGGLYATAETLGCRLAGQRAGVLISCERCRVWRYGEVRSARTNSRPPDLAPPQRALPRRPVPGFRAVYQRGATRLARAAVTSSREEIAHSAPMIRNGPNGMNVLSVIRRASSRTTITTPASSAP